MIKNKKGYTLVESLVSLTIIVVIASIILSFFGKIFGIPISVSEGERSGIVNKISKKGIFWKTWEADLNLGGMTTNSEGNSIPNVWKFSITDEKLAEEISRVSRQGLRVTIQYDQKVSLPWSQGETNYLAVGVRGASQNTDSVK